MTARSNVGLAFLPLISPLALLMAASLGGAASAATLPWTTTHTRAHQVFANNGAPLAAAEEAAPGQALHIVVTLQVHDREGLDRRVASILQGHADEVLGGGQLASLHLPTPAEAQAVVDHLAQAGFRDIVVAPNRLVVSAEGSVATAKRAFRTEIHNFGQGDSRVFANTTDVQVPSALSRIVLSVHGLQNAHGVRTLGHEWVQAEPTAQANPQATATATSTVVGHNPTDFPLVYDAASLPAASNATLAIIANGDLTQTLADLATFTAKAGYPAANASVTYVGTKGSDTSAVSEWDIDSQNALAAAGGKLKQIIFYASPTLADSQLTQSINQAVVDNKAKIISISLGECENAAKQAGVEASDDQIFAVGVAQGQTFMVSAGDAGSAECGKVAGQSYPAVSPYVVAVGGTTLSTASANATAWAGEAAWSGTGGGPSTTEPLPSWQKSTALAASSKYRGVPDLAFDANPASGANVIVKGHAQTWGGTSLAAPLFAGFWARIQSLNNNKLVSPNVAIYQYAAANAALLHDIASGSNGGYSAKAGWDYASGWGSLDVAKFSAFVSGHSGF